MYYTGCVQWQRYDHSFFFFSFFFVFLRSLIYYNYFFSFSFSILPWPTGWSTIVGSSIIHQRDFFLDISPLFFSLLFFAPHCDFLVSRYIKLSIFPEDGGRGEGGAGDGSADQRQCEKVFASKFGNIRKLDGTALLIIIWSIKLKENTSSHHIYIYI